MLKNLAMLGIILCTFSMQAGNDSAKGGEALISGDLFPVDLQEGVYHINENFPAVFIFKFKGIPQQLKNPRIVLDLPEGYSCLGAYPNFPNFPSSGTWKPERMTTETFKRSEIPYTRYIIYLNNYLVLQLNPNAVSGSIERVYIKTSSKAAGEGKKEAFWTLATDDWEGPEKKFELILLPELVLATPRLNKFGVMIATLKSLTVPDDDIRGAYLSYWKSISDKPYTILSNWPYLNADQVKFAIDNFQIVRMLASNHGGTPMLNAKDWYAKNGVNPPLMILKSGKIANEGVFTMQLCPGFLAKDASYWNDFVAPEIKRTAAMFKTPNPENTYKSGIMYDIEPATKDFCYCDNCRKDFAIFAKLDKIPSAVEIEKQYSQEWFNFRVRQSADIISQFCKCVKKNFTVPAIVCSDPLHVSGLQQWCGVDVSLSDMDADLFMNMPYYSGLEFFKDIALNVKTLRTRNFPLINPAEEDKMFFTRYTPEKIKQNIIACAALGCVGFGFWPSDVLDARYLMQIKSAFSTVALAENYYFAKRNDGIACVKTEKYFEMNIKDEGRDISVGLPVFNENLQWLAHQRDDDFLVTVFNYSDQYDAIVTMSIPGLANSNYTARELDADSLLCKDGDDPIGNEEIKQGFLVEIPKNGVKVIEIARGPMTCQGERILQKEVSEALADTKKKFQNNYSFKEIKQDSAEIMWGITKDTQIPLLKLISDKRKIYVDIENGSSIISWAGKNKDDNDLLFYKQRGYLGDLILNNDKLGKGAYPFILDKSFIAEDGSPVVKSVYTVPAELNASTDAGLMEGLKIEKQVALENKGNTVKIKYTFTNNNSLRKDIMLGFRIKNCPKPGGSLVNEDLSRITQISIDSSDGQKLIKDDTAEKDNYILAEGCVQASFFKVMPKPFKWIVSPVKVFAGIGKFNEQMIFAPDKENTAGVYVWWSKYSGYTIEFPSKETLLKYGESISSEYSVTGQ